MNELTREEWECIRGELYSQRKSLGELLEAFNKTSPYEYGYDDDEMVKAIDDIEGQIKLIDGILKKINPIGWIAL